jgi:hypothetical protein
MLAASAEVVEDERAANAGLPVAPRRGFCRPFQTRIADGFFVMCWPLVTRSAQMLIESVSVES